MRIHKNQNQQKVQNKMHGAIENEHYIIMIIMDVYENDENINVQIMHHVDRGM